MNKKSTGRIVLVLIAFSFILFVGCQSSVEEKYYDNGQLKEKYVVNNKGKLDGPYTSYYRDGNIKKKGTYNNGNRVDTFKRYYADSTLKWQVYYENGEENGVYKGYYKNGNLKIAANYKDGKIHGLTKRYYKDGTLKKIIHYKNGVEHGQYVSFYENGDVKHIKKSKNDSTVAYIDYAKDGSVNDAFFKIDIQAPDTVHVGDSIRAKFKIAQMKTGKYVGDTMTSYFTMVNFRPPEEKIHKKLDTDSNGVAYFNGKLRKPGVHSLNINVLFDTTISRSSNHHFIKVLDTVKPKQ